MNRKFVRFVVGGNYKGAESQYGIIAELSYLLESGKLTNEEKLFCERFFEWINKVLPEPPFDEKSWSKDAVSWLKADQRELVDRFREMCFFLEDRDVNTCVVFSSKPGMKVYEDDYQIVAIPNLV